MSRCESIQTQLTAFADGEASRWQTWLIRRHLGGCAGCKSEEAALRRAIPLQSQALRRAIDVPQLDVDEMRRKLRVAIAAEPETASAPAYGSRWALSLRPVLAGVGAVALLLMTISWGLGGPSTMLTTLGLLEPPKAVASKPDMFYEYPMFQNLDALENFDAINAVPLEEEQSLAPLTGWVG